LNGSNLCDESLVFATGIDGGLKSFERNADGHCCGSRLRHDFGEGGAEESSVTPRKEQGDSEAERCEFLWVASRDALNDAVEA
jgi:hypothetical protein